MTEEAEVELKRLHQAGELSKLDVKALLRWLDEMEEHGPDYIAKSPEWHDHELERDWRGYRSSAFSSSGRVIYRVLDRAIIVEVHHVTTEHKYKK